MNKLFCILPLILLLQVGYCKNTFLCNFCIWSIELVKSILRSNLFYSRYGQEQYQSCMKSRTKAYCDGANINNWPFIYRVKFSVINSNEFCAKYKTYFFGIWILRFAGMGIVALINMLLKYTIMGTIIMYK